MKHLLALGSAFLLFCSFDLTNGQFNFGGFQPVPTNVATTFPQIQPAVSVGDSALRTIEASPTQPLLNPNTIRFHNFQPTPPPQPPQQTQPTQAVDPTTSTLTQLDPSTIDVAMGTNLINTPIQVVDPTIVNNQPTGPSLVVPSTIANADAIFLSQLQPQVQPQVQPQPLNPNFAGFTTTQGIGGTATTLFDPRTGQIIQLSPQINTASALTGIPTSTVNNVNALPPPQPTVSALPSALGTNGSTVNIFNNNNNNNNNLATGPIPSTAPTALTLPVNTITALNSPTDLGNLTNLNALVDPIPTDLPRTNPGVVTPNTAAVPNTAVVPNVNIGTNPGVFTNTGVFNPGNNNFNTGIVPSNNFPVNTNPNTGVFNPINLNTGIVNPINPGAVNTNAGNINNGNLNTGIGIGNLNGASTSNNLNAINTANVNNLNTVNTNTNTNVVTNPNSVTTSGFIPQPPNPVAVGDVVNPSTGGGNFATIGNINAPRSAVTIFAQPNGLYNRPTF